ncbi:helix-turn-helix domain-containing protein [Chryseobacterium sp. ISL-6]|uniref:helix-turn-helix domain-containing protein n=1 Tax=Chryseobacterium sp. ISL-6 TaxID=2819143 RepID=UPI001BE5CCAD|nr:helix-turn-helix domain-containing protein [Chryseobacterium sp. ISL-6]MBT2622565.1 AraC family transcriptional regulator [Chryseobacterium sp. ISL-6]
MASKEPIRIKTISEFHNLRGLPKPKHPLISVVNFSEMQNRPQIGDESLIFDFYSLSVKRNMNHKYKYGQKDYDFDEGILFFIAPNQVLRIETEENSQPPSGWMLLIHPDFLWNKNLAKTISQYEFFDYSLHEALFLSDDEEQILVQLIENIRQEYNTNTDKFSSDIMASLLETLFNYSNRFYQRQFITRDKAHHEILERLEMILNQYLNSDLIVNNGIPTVQYISEQLNISPGYLRTLLQNLTGQSTQHFIHQKLIEKAKEKLSTTSNSVSEIAYELGFEHPQSFSKFFKKMTSTTPLAFRELFN